MTDQTAQDPPLPPHAGSQEPAEGDAVPDAGPGAERAPDDATGPRSANDGPA